MAQAAFYSSFKDIWLVGGVRTPMVDYCTSFSQLSPTDMGINVAREVLARTGIAATDIGSVVAGNMAPGDAYQYMLPR
ncbi:hypothetical protein ACMWQB_29765, partial [Escherichia coli]